jgi:ATP-dependent helicase YprA (DUF1998 family)
MSSDVFCVGITQLYSHQAQAIHAINRGANVVVATSTSSGKSLCFNIPVFGIHPSFHDHTTTLFKLTDMNRINENKTEQLERDSTSRALYLFPTKALARDQRRATRQFLDRFGNSWISVIIVSCPTMTFFPIITRSEYLTVLAERMTFCYRSKSNM